MSLLCSWFSAVTTLHTPTSMLSRGNEAGNSWLIVAEEGKDKGAEQGKDKGAEQGKDKGAEQGRIKEQRSISEGRS